MTRGEIALRLTQARVESGLTQVQIAAAMGTSQPAIARAESGYRMPSIEFIDRWARATGKPISITLGRAATRLPSRSDKRRLVRAELGPGRFNPWERQPTAIEAANLEKTGLNRAYFDRLTTPGTDGRRRRRAR